jgi:hypothetical protein
MISRCFPVSTTQVISGIVMPVSAMFVAEKGKSIYAVDTTLLDTPMTIFLIPAGGTSNTAF